MDPSRYRWCSTRFPTELIECHRFGLICRQNGVVNAQSSSTVPGGRPQPLRPDHGPLPALRRSRRTAPLVAALVGLVGLAACTTERRALPIPLPSTAETSSIYDGSGNLITVLRSDENRVSIPLTAMPQSLQNAVVAIEDRRFWEHDGVDPRAIGRAVSTNTDEIGRASCRERV